MVSFRFYVRKHQKKPIRGVFGKGIKEERRSTLIWSPEGKLPFGQRRPEHDRDAPAFSVEKNPKKPGGFVAGVSKGGRASLGTRSCLQGLACYTLDGGRGRKGLVEWQHKTLSLTHK